MKSLGGLILPDSLQWTDRWEWTPTAQEVARTLAGSLVVWSQQLIGGQPVTLAAEDAVTWLSLTQVETLSALASQAGATFTLIWDSETFTVMFRIHDPPVVAFKPLWPHHTLFTGTIKLIKV